MRNFSILKRYLASFAIVLLLASGGFYFAQNTAQAKKSSVTKWQKKLVKMGIDQTLWQKYLPKISRGECNKVVNLWKKTGGAAQTTTTPAATSGSLGPEISVGLWYFEKSKFKKDEDAFRIDANKDYRIRKKDGGDVVATVFGGTTTKVVYDDDGKLKVYSSIADTLVDDEVWFDAADGDNASIIFDVHHSIKSDWGDYSHFRGKISVNYYHGKDIYNGNSSSVTQIWVSNKLPLEQYVWGAGETTGTGGSDHAKVMVTIFRTYGDWYIENATKYKPLGFTIRSDAGSQIYLGYDREKKYPKVKEVADETRGKIVEYDGEVALTPYCSYTDGKTRSMKGYPYLKSVKDPYGKKKGLKPGQGGNHMWGVSANGALGYAEHGKSWEWILQHYYSKVDISSIY